MAEAAGTVKRISIEDGSIAKILRGPTAPLTCLCLGPNDSIFAGCWDKTIWQFNLNSKPSTPSLPPVQYSNGHSDFVKSVLFLHLADNSPLLITGSADGDILFWSPSPTGSTKPLHRLSPQSRAIEHLAIDPLSSPSTPTIYAATSQRDIHTFTLPSTLTTLTTTTLNPTPLLLHETSVYSLHFDADADLWTSSADKTAKHTPRSDDDSNPFQSQKPDTTLQHPDFVRAVLTTPPLPVVGILVVTACRDEHVRIWSATSAQLLHLFRGHYEEVTGLCLVSVSVPRGPGPVGAGAKAASGARRGLVAASVSIDGTVRTWDYTPSGIERAVVARERGGAAEGGEMVGGDGGGTLILSPGKKDDKSGGGGGGGNEFGLTEEEEAELRALMEGEEEEGLDKMAMGEQ